MHSVEVIIVDDGSDNKGNGSEPPNSTFVGRFDGQLNIRYFYFEHTGNRGNNRTFGVRQSRGERILFLDGDMIPDHRAIGKHMEITKKSKRTVSLGIRWKLLEIENSMVPAEPESLTAALLQQYPAYSDERFPLWAQGDIAQLSECPWIQVYSNNLCLWRETYNRVGGFDPAFGGNWGVEDIELGYRLHREGCTIICSRDIVFYHIHHPENAREKFKQLEYNLQFFFRKYPRWEIELFRFEYRIWIPAYFSIRARIQENVHLVRKVERSLSWSDYLEGRGVCIGIVDEELIGRKAIECIVSTLPVACSKKQLPLLGTTLAFPDREFEFALVSDNYRKIDLFDQVFLEASRIAKRVLVLDDKGIVPTSNRLVLHDPENTLPFHRRIHRKKVILSISSVNNEITIDHANYFNLAWFLYKRGVDVCLRDNLSDLDAPDLSLKYYYIENVSKRRLLEQLYRGTNDFDASIPNISHERYLCDRSYGANYLWYDCFFENEMPEFKEEFLSQYDFFLYRNHSTYDMLGSPHAAAFLPLGVDSETLQPYDNRQSPVDGPLRFVWFCTFFNEGCGFDILVESFIKAFGKNTDVFLDLYIAQAPQPRFFQYINESFNRYLTSYDRLLWLSAYDFFQSTFETIKQCSNISVTVSTLSDQRVHDIIAEAHGIIDTHPGLNASPIVIDALALGRRIIRPGNNVYEWYCRNEAFIDVGYERANLIWCGARPEVVWKGTTYQSKHRYQLMHRVNGDSLAAVLSMVYNNQKILEVDPKFTNDFRRANDWNVVVDRLLPLLG